MPVAQQDEWRPDMPKQPDGDAIDRLEAALARIAAAAGRRQDELRVAELTAQAAQHEADLLLRAHDDRRQEETIEREAIAASVSGQRLDETRELAMRLDALIATLRAATGDAGPPAAPAGEEG